MRLKAEISFLWFLVSSSNSSGTLFLQVYLSKFKNRSNAQLNADICKFLSNHQISQKHRIIEP